jgi:hypothetical protein
LFDYADKDRSDNYLLKSELQSFSKGINLKVSPSGDTVDFKNDLISWKTSYIQRSTRDVSKTEAYRIVLAVANQDTFFYCQDFKIDPDKETFLIDICKYQIRMKFSEYELEDSNFQGISWTISEILLEPYLKKAVIGYLYDDGGSQLKILKRDTVRGYAYVDINKQIV